MPDQRGPLAPHQLMATRVRTLAATARAITVQTLHDGRTHPARGAVADDGRPILLLEPGTALHAALRAAAADGPARAAARVTLQTPRELAGHNLVRANLGVCGWLTAVPEPQLRAAAVSIAEMCPDEALFSVLERFGDPDAPLLAELEVVSIDCDTMTTHTTLPARDYLAAETDPLAGAAENIIEHINAGHPYLIAPCLTTMLGEQIDTAWLWEVDSQGITFLAELPGPGGASLVTLDWPEPISDSTTLTLALHTMLQRGRNCACARPEPQRPGDRDQDPA
ncbi:MAG TPA: hypothetical protein VGX23_27355 [Actinocrinis sp.]|nr:hypothetical protein [Actinocrinis sp.]